MLLLFSIFSDASSPRNTSFCKYWGSHNYEHCLLVLPSARVPATLHGGHSATSTLCQVVWQSLAGSGQLSFSSALKRNQFSFLLRKNFFFFVKFQAENPSQCLPEKPGTAREWPLYELISIDLTEWIEGKRRLLPIDLGVTEVNICKRTKKRTEEKFQFPINEIVL